MKYYVYIVNTGTECHPSTGDISTGSQQQWVQVRHTELVLKKKQEPNLMISSWLNFHYFKQISVHFAFLLYEIYWTNMHTAACFPTKGNSCPDVRMREYMHQRDAIVWVWHADADMSYLEV